MFHSTLFALLALSSIGLVSADEETKTRPAEDYLLFMDPSAVYIDEFLWISSELDKKASTTSEPLDLLQIIDESRILVSEILRGSTSTTIEHPKNRLLHLRDVLDELVGLSEPVEYWHDDCRVLHTMQHFLDSIDAIFGGVDNFIKMMHQTTPLTSQHAKLFSYLKHYELQHISACLKILVEEFNHEAHNGKWDHEIEFDQLLTPRADLSLGTDEELLNAATDYDFTSYDYDNLMMLKSLENNSLGSPLKGGQVNEQAMAEMCADLRADLYDVFVTYDIAKALIPEEAQEIVRDQGVRFFKFDEYFRLCNEWKSH